MSEALYNSLKRVFSDPHFTDKEIIDPQVEKVLNEISLGNRYRVPIYAEFWKLFFCCSRVLAQKYIDHSELNKKFGMEMYKEHIGVVENGIMNFDKAEFQTTLQQRFPFYQEIFSKGERNKENINKAGEFFINTFWEPYLDNEKVNKQSVILVAGNCVYDIYDEINDMFKTARTFESMGGPGTELSEEEAVMAGVGKTETNVAGLALGIIGGLLIVGLLAYLIFTFLNK
ncbi:MAG: hypothetical protein ACLFQV_09600 [Vulcanimicrobiota bacterium]